MLLLVNGEKPLLENRYFMIQGNKAFFFIIPKNMKLVSNIHICMYLYFKKKSIRRKMKDTCVIAFSNFLFPLEKHFRIFCSKEASKLPSSLHWWSIIPIPSSMMYKFYLFDQLLPKDVSFILIKRRWVICQHLILKSLL